MPKQSKESFKSDYEAYVARAIQLVHSEKTRGSVLDMLGGPDPVGSVVKLATTIMQRIDTAAREAGIEVGDTVKVFGANEIVGLLVEFGNEAGKFNLDEDYAMLALSGTVQEYIKAEMKAGSLDGQKLNVALQADLRKLPPAKRKEIQLSQLKLVETAKRYNKELRDERFN